MKFDVSLLALAAVRELEDPLKMLDQAVLDMQADMVKMRQAAAQVRAAPSLAPAPAHKPLAALHADVVRLQWHAICSAAS